MTAEAGSDPVFSGRAFRVRVVNHRGADGQPRVYEVVERVPAVAVMAEVGGRLVVIRQHRPAVGRVLYELPAGKVDAGESPEAAARRELSEETGYCAERLSPITALYPSPGYTTEVVTFYWAPEPVPGPAHPEAGEELEILHLARAEVAALLGSFATAPLNGLFVVGASWWLHR